MSRSQLAFLVFCLVLICVSGALVWYVGPTASAIAFDADRRSAPYFVLHLVPQTPKMDVAAVAAYRAELDATIAMEGARPLWSSTHTRRHESRTRAGSLRGAMEAVDLIRFEHGADLVHMLTGEEFRALVGGAPFEVRLAGSATPPQDLRAGEVAVLVLYEGVGSDYASPFGVPGESGWLIVLDRFGGRIAWDTPIEWIRGRETWNRLLLLQFPDTRSAGAWLRDPATQTERAIVSRHIGDLLVLAAFAD